MQTYANGRQIMKANAGAAQVAVGGADVFALVALRPHLRSVAATLRHPHVAVAEHGADAALASVAGAAVWLAAAWLAFGLLAASAIGIPGAGGRAAAPPSPAPPPPPPPAAPPRPP